MLIHSFIHFSDRFLDCSDLNPSYSRSTHIQSSLRVVLQKLFRNISSPRFPNAIGIILCILLFFGELWKKFATSVVFRKFIKSRVTDEI
jgi:hypothetical protein